MARKTSSECRREYEAGPSTRPPVQRAYLAARVYRDAHAVQFAAGLSRLRRGGEALNDGAKFRDGSFAVLECEQRLAFVQVRNGCLLIAGVVVQDVVVVLDGCGILSMAIVDLAEVVPGLSRELVGWVGLNDLIEFLGGNGIFGGHVIVECDAEKRAGRLSGGLRGLDGRKVARSGVGSLASGKGNIGRGFVIRHGRARWGLS